MKTPNFWRQRNLLAYLLWPFSVLYFLGFSWRVFFTKAKKNKIPVICIGNLIAGGAGKTPLAIEIGLILKKLGINFAYLSKGYGGEIESFTLVNSDFHSAKDVGDEPLLLAEISDAFISKNRAFGVSLISKMPEKELIIMDDGLQNPTVFKDYKILVIDGNYGFGNEMLIPAGPLRENIESGIKKADLIIIVGLDKNNIQARFCRGKKVIFAKIKPVNFKKFKNTPIVAFCGIGRPDKFYESLENINLNPVKKFSFPDHYFYQNDEIEEIISIAIKEKAMILTTKKDWVRIDPKYKNQIQYLDIRMEFDDENYIENMLGKYGHNFRQN